MILSVINSLIENYKQFVQTPAYGEIHKWESLKTFQDRWDIEDEDFLKMYDESFQSPDSNNLWASESFYPKEIMLQFIKNDPEKVRQMFRELFNEEESISIRIDRFSYNCDNILLEMQNHDSELLHHFHDGFRTISVYLGFKYPAKYTIYTFTEFKEFMEIVRAKTIPGKNEIERFFKVMRTINTLLFKDEELIQIHKNLCADPKFYQDETLLLVQDFYWCVTRYDLYKKL